MIHRLLCRLGIHHWEIIIDEERSPSRVPAHPHPLAAMFEWIVLPRCRRCKVCGKVKR